MLFWQALMSAIRGTFTFSGRSDRLEQWTFAFLSAVAVVGVIVLGELGVSFNKHVLLFLFLGALWMFVAHISLMVRRLHDNNRSGFYMFIPAAAASIWLTGWLGANGYVDFQTKFFLAYGQWIELIGRIGGVASFGLVNWIFVSEGDTEENLYGDPPL